jgi:hypothetical protein
MGAPNEALQNLFELLCNKAISKDLKLQIINYFSTPITIYSPPYLETPYLFHYKYLLTIVMVMGAPSKCLQYLFQLHKQQKNVQKF